MDTFYSPHKFFGVPDGAYIYTDEQLETELQQGISYRRFEHLLGRIDISSGYFYQSFKENNTSLVTLSIKKISRFTQRILQSINYNSIKKKGGRKFHFFT